MHMNTESTRATPGTATSRTNALCERITNIQFENLDEQVRSLATQLFLDGIAVAVAGARQEKPPQILADYVREQGGPAQATVFNFGFRASLTQAAYVNGASMHVLDYEPMWNPPNHQLSTCLPAILALAEHLQADGATVLTALVKGIETMSRLRWAAPRQRDLTVIDFHPPGIVGPMGAAVASSHLLGLDAETMGRALGIVASRCSALWPNNGTDTKSLHCGLASSNGLEAALLASRGFNSNPDILGAPRGYVETFFDRDEFLWDELMAFGNPYRMVNPGYAIKMWPSQFGTHYIFTACFELRDQITDIEDIRSVVITCPPLDYPNRPRPATGLAGKFSWQYAAALALLDSEIGMHSFSDERRFAPDMEALLPRVSLCQPEEFTFSMDGCGDPFVVTVELASGRRLQASCNGPRGSWGKEPITLEEHSVKLRECLSLGLPAADVDEILILGKSLAVLTPAELATLLRLLGNFQ
jgi:aconitate decarboxylase